MKALGFEEKSVGTQTLGSGLGCVHVSLYDPPVDLETAQEVETQGRLVQVSCQRAQCSSVQACVRTVLTFPSTSCPPRF